MVGYARTAKPEAITTLKTRAKARIAKYGHYFYLQIVTLLPFKILNFSFSMSKVDLCRCQTIEEYGAAIYGWFHGYYYGTNFLSYPPSKDLLDHSSLLLVLFVFSARLAT